MSKDKVVRSRADGAMDYDQLTETIKYLLDAAWGPKWGQFTPDGPNVTNPHDINYPIIVHYLQHMEPGLVGKNTREIRPRYRQMEETPDANGTMPPLTKVMGQVFDGVIVFEVWEETNFQVNKLARRFRETLSIYSGFLKGKGLKEFQFLKMETDLWDSKIHDAHKVRRLSYFVKFEEITTVPIDVLRVMDVVEERLQEIAETQLGE